MIREPVIDLRFTTIQESVPDFIYIELQKYIAKCNTYYPQPLFLKESLTKKFKLTSTGWVFLTNGVDEALRISLEVFGKNTHLFTPTEYSTTYQFCPSLKTHYSLVSDRYQISSSHIKDATLIIVANPNNPVGYTERETIIKLLQNNPKAMIAIDEIYGEYSPELSVTDLLSKYKNLIIFRGFSKSYGLAGIRLGYILSNPSNIKKLSIKSTWSNVSYLSCGMGQIALEHENYYVQLRQTIIQRKEALIKFLEKRNLKVIPSLINTITIQFPALKKANHFVQDLAEKNIFVNQGESGGKVGNNDSFVSFVVGTSEQMNDLIKSLT